MRFRFRKGTGKINAAALARGLGVERQTVRRILLQQRFEGDNGDLPQIDYEPSGRLLDGIAQLTGCTSRAEVESQIGSAPSHDDLDELI